MIINWAMFHRYLDNQCYFLVLFWPEHALLVLLPWLTAYFAEGLKTPTSALYGWSWYLFGVPPLHHFYKHSAIWVVFPMTRSSIVIWCDLVMSHYIPLNPIKPIKSLYPISPTILNPIKSHEMLGESLIQSICRSVAPGWKTRFSWVESRSLMPI